MTKEKEEARDTLIKKCLRICVLVEELHDEISEAVEEKDSIWCNNDNQRVSLDLRVALRLLLSCADTMQLVGRHHIMRETGESWAQLCKRLNLKQFGA